MRDQGGGQGCENCGRHWFGRDLLATLWAGVGDTDVDAIGSRGLAGWNVTLIVTIPGEYSYEKFAWQHGWPLLFLRHLEDPSGLTGTILEPWEIWLHLREIKPLPAADGSWHEHWMGVLATR